MKSSEIRIRDPFILSDAKSGTYYLYGTTDKLPWGGPGEGFDVYAGRDLVNWEGPYPAFRKPKDFWAEENFWAPEVHRVDGAYYMFASFKAKGKSRGTQILKSESPLGPFVPISEGPVTPETWECLDGTFYEQDGEPWIIFCHEWTQIRNGAVCAMRLSAGLKEAAGEPQVLFHAKDAPWVRAAGEGDNYVTDGPFLFNEGGRLYMLWSSFAATGYAMGLAVSESGRVDGPWRQMERPLDVKDGGHGMIFESFEGKKYLIYHAPNKTPLERPVMVDFSF